MMKEEITKVLEMVQQGIVTAAEGQQLLEAMGAYDVPKDSTAVTSRKARKLYVRVLSADGDKVNISLPLNLVKSGLALGMHFSGNTFEQLTEKGIDLNEIVKMVDEMAESGDMGDIVNVEDAKGDTVHIYLE